MYVSNSCLNFNVIRSVFLFGKFENETSDADIYTFVFMDVKRLVGVSC